MLGERDNNMTGYYNIVCLAGSMFLGGQLQIRPGLALNFEYRCHSFKITLEGPNFQNHHVFMQRLHGSNRGTN